MGRFISYLKARKMISKGYLYHLVWVKNSSSETQILESILLVGEFQEISSKDLHEVSLEREIDFGIDLQPISIPLYRIAQQSLRN